MEIERVETIFGTFCCWRNDLITAQLKAFSAHTRNEIAMVRTFLAPGDCVIDIGAHVGTYTVPFARFVAPEGRVFSFEANPPNFALLQENIRANGLAGMVTVTHAVVSDLGGTFTMHLQAGANSGMFYFLPTPGTGDLLPTVHVDSWLEGLPEPVRVALIKIDVEGAELGVLRSCRRTLERERPVLYIEISPASLGRFGATVGEVEELLAGLGYHFFRNVGERNSSHDRFQLARLPSVADGGPFFDLLAVHPDSSRYPGAKD